MKKPFTILFGKFQRLRILEDTLGEGLEAHALAGHEVKKGMGYGCWAIQQEGSNELDKTWINEIAKILAQKRGARGLV